MCDSPWRLLRDGPTDGPWNMAVDEAVARAAGEGQAPATLRFYTWSAPTISFGYLQRAPGGVDLGACRREGIPLVRRITGGRAVLHADELTYSVAVPLCGPWRTLSVPAGFTLIARPLIAGLRRLGVEASTGEAGLPPGTGRETGACFLLPRMPAILVKGRKLIGSAQRRFHRSLLQHGSILLDFDPHLHQVVFPAWPRIDSTAGVTSLRALLGASPVMERLVSALTAGWREVFGAPCIPGELIPAERGAAEDLVRARYGSAAWTFQR
ncbi:MAG: lipoate--protein ligase family protein [candidate division NC10 bacterium]|nr:lipoate--protein ligase family protein [candidate division NC10 bacterium]